jgi:hypothetical protein
MNLRPAEGVFCMNVVEKQVFLIQRTSLREKLASNFGKKANNYLLTTQISNAGETPMFFSIPSSYTIIHMGVECVIVKV